MEKQNEQRVVRFASEKIELQCEWQDCLVTENLMHSYVAHICNNHLPQLCEENLNCQWRDCEGFTDTLSELRRHILFHAFHTKIKCYGKNIQVRKNLASCCLGTHGHNMIPELPEPFICLWNNCQEVFENPESFYRHVDYHAESCTGVKGEKITLKCIWTGCIKTFSDQYKLKDHLRSHTQEKVIACPTCGGMFASRTKFLEHIQRQTLVADESNSSNMYTCEFCSRKMATERLLRDHMRLHVNHYKCPCCDMTCPTPSALQTHVFYRHSEAKPYCCQYCDYRCKRQNDLRKHLETHSLVPTLLCPTENCEYSTRSHASFKRHIRSMHQGEEPPKYACHLCNKITTRGNYLTKHLVSKHNFCWPSGHCRFRYHQHTDGLYRLQTVRLESLELSEAVLYENGEIVQNSIIQNSQIPNITASEAILYENGEIVQNNIIQNSQIPNITASEAILYENGEIVQNSIIHNSQIPNITASEAILTVVSGNSIESANVIQLSEIEPSLIDDTLIM